MALLNSQAYPWLTDSLQQLSQLYRQQRLAHALLFNGPEGIGKLELGQMLAALLLCKTPAVAAACGQCKSCLLLAAGNHADLLLLQPENASLGVDEIRRLTDFTQGKAQQSGNKVVLLRHAERLTEAAANALLKTLVMSDYKQYLNKYWRPLKLQTRRRLQEPQMPLAKPHPQMQMHSPLKSWFPRSLQPLRKNWWLCVAMTVLA